MSGFRFIVGGLLFLAACSPDASDMGEIPSASMQVRSLKSGRSSPLQPDSSAVRSDDSHSVSSVSTPTCETPPSSRPRELTAREEGRKHFGEPAPLRTVRRTSTTSSSSTRWETYRWRTVSTTWTRRPGTRGSEVPHPVSPVPPVAPVVAVQEFEPGALCRVYHVALPGSLSAHGNIVVNNSGTEQERLRAIQQQLNAGAVALDEGYDATSLDFDGRKINKHGGNVVVWDGFLIVKRAGRYAIMLSAPCQRGGAQVVVNGIGVVGSPTTTSTCEVELAKGPNKIQVLVYGDETPTLEYRLMTSLRPAQKITPAMLSHIVEDEEW